MESSKRESKYHLSINFLVEKKTVFPVTEKFKPRTFQYLENIIFHYFFGSKKDSISHLRKVQNKNFSVTSKYHISINLFGKY